MILAENSCPFLVLDFLGASHTVTKFFLAPGRAPFGLLPPLHGVTATKSVSCIWSEISVLSLGCAFKLTKRLLALSIPVMLNMSDVGTQLTHRCACD